MFGWVCWTPLEKILTLNHCTNNSKYSLCMFSNHTCLDRCCVDVTTKGTSPSTREGLDSERVSDEHFQVSYYSCEVGPTDSGVCDHVPTAVPYLNSIPSYVAITVRLRNRVPLRSYTWNRLRSGPHVRWWRLRYCNDKQNVKNASTPNSLTWQVLKRC